jgi:hypothetical protein
LPIGLGHLGVVFPPLGSKKVVIPSLKIVPNLACIWP